MIIRKVWESPSRRTGLEVVKTDNDRKEKGGK